MRPPLRISVLTPTLNEERHIGGAVASAIEAAADEVIVADGGSIDGTVRVARQAGAKVVSGERGRGSQLRLASQHATGEVLLVLHADNRLPPTAREQIERALSNRRVVCGAFRQRIDAEGWLYRWLERGNALRAHRLRLPYGDQGVFVRRETLEAIGGVPSLPLMEDVAMMQRLNRLINRRGDRSPVLLDGPLAVSARRWRQAGVVRQTLRNWSLLAAFVCGVSAERLAARYAPHAEGDAT
ncbi:MAG: TIGR04283 family arsenosugar biosynthesis glycosyltransferase [Planctomycetota bacterium]